MRRWRRRRTPHIRHCSSTTYGAETKSSRLLMRAKNSIMDDDATFVISIRRRGRIKVTIQLQQISMNVRQPGHFIQRPVVHAQPFQVSSLCHGVHGGFRTVLSIGHAQANVGYVRGTSFQPDAIGFFVVTLVQPIKERHSDGSRRRLFQHDCIRRHHR